MNPEQLKAIIEEVIREGYTIDWWVYILIALFAVVGSFIGAYAKKKGQNLAKKEDIVQLEEEIKRTTQITEEIKANLAINRSVGESELEYRKQQLAEFYGPIYAYLKSNSEIYPLWMNQKLTEINQDIISLFRKQNEHIILILTTKSHLIDGNSMPPVFTKFTTSAIIWNLYCSRPQTPFLPNHVATIEQVKFPEEFRTYIFSKTEELKKKLDDLHQEYKFKKN